MIKLMLKITMLSSVFISLSTLASDGFYFKYLNEKIVAYSDKINFCDDTKVTPVFSIVELASLKEIVSKKAPVLSYLSIKSYNECLQPERSELAEILLSYNYVDVSLYTKKLAISTGKLIFIRDFEGLQLYKTLNNKDKNFIDSIGGFKKPFNELEVFEIIMGM